MLIYINQHFLLIGEKTMDLNNEKYAEIKADIVKLLKSCTIINFKKTPWFEDSNMLSNSMGNPYFEKSESWPISELSGKPLHFVFQVFNNGKLGFPDEIGLIQFYIDLENIPQNYQDKGFLIKTYNNPMKENSIIIKQEEGNLCEMALWEYTNNVLSAPSWEDVPYQLVRRIIDLENETDNNEIYNDIKYELKCDNQMKSKILGFPGWYQGVDPLVEQLENCLFLMDIHSGLKWCWMGAIYFFWDYNSKKLLYFFQTT